MVNPEEEPDDDTGIGEVQELHLDDMTGEDREQERDINLMQKEPDTGLLDETPPSVLPSEVQGEGVSRTPAVMEEYTIIPEYGINTNPKEPVYSLERKEYVENERYSLTLEEAYFINHKLTVTLRILLKDDTIENLERLERNFSVESVTYRDNIWRKRLGESRDIDLHTQLSISYFENILIPDMGEKMENMSIQFAEGGSISFDMISVEQEKVTEYPYQSDRRIWWYISGAQIRGRGVDHCYSSAG